MAIHQHHYEIKIAHTILSQTNALGGIEINTVQDNGLF